MPTLLPSEVEVMEVDPAPVPIAVNGFSEHPRLIQLRFQNTNGHNLNPKDVYSKFKDTVVHNFDADIKSSVLVQSIESSINSASSIIHQAEETSMKLYRFVSSNNFLFKTPISNLRTHPYLKATTKTPVVNDNAHPKYPINTYAKKEPTQSDGLEILNTIPAAPKVNLPPAGELVRSNLEIGMKIWAMKKDFLCVWVRGVITTVREPTPKEKIYKVRWDNPRNSYYRFYSPKHLAYENISPVIIPVGTRIIARYTDSAGRSAYYAGITAEPPKVTNNKRYLIFFDDGCAQYVKHEDLHVVCVQSNDVADDVHENISEFVRAYLQQYPERPMVKLQKDQYVKTEYNCEWSDAKVLEVDCSMVKMFFLSTQRTEWIYRGSTRLKPLRNELANAEAHRLEGKHSRRRFTTAPRKPDQPYVEYTREEDVVVIDSDSDSENKTPTDTKKRKNTARKSLGTKPLTSLNVRANPVFRVPDKKSHLGYKEISIIKSFTRIPFFNHSCAFLCRERVDPATHKGKNPLLIPIYLGWERQLRKFRACGPGPRLIITYRAPCGRHLRNPQDVQNYLSLIKSRVTIDFFSFNSNVNLFRTFRPKDILYQDSDITQGKENLPVSCVNSLCDEPPPYVEYSAERFPGKGVFLNLDEGFLCGCSCTDNCQNPATCECQNITKEASQGATFGYQFRRLKEPVMTGIYECNSRCKCNSQCGNRVVQHGITVRLQMFKTQFKGWGIRCLDDIDAGQFICIYAGQLLTEDGADADGKECGDEYLAELDHIEVVEKNKEGYESDVADMDMDYKPLKDIKTDKTAFSDDYSNSSDSDVLFADSDSEFESSSLRSTATSTYATRSRFKNGRRKSNASSEALSSNLASEDSSSSHASDKKDTKDLPDISFNLKSCRITPRELSPDSAEALGKVELKFKPKISGKGTSPRVVAKKSSSMKNPMNNADGNTETKFRSVRNYYGEDSLYIMDAKSKGNIGRYLNHSCEPNVFVQNVFVDTHDLRFPAVAFFAHSCIDAGTELTWDYNYEVGSVTDKVMYCYCEAPSCRGRLL